MSRVKQQLSKLHCSTHHHKFSRVTEFNGVVKTVEFISCISLAKSPWRVVWTDQAKFDTDQVNHVPCSIITTIALLKRSW